MDNLTKMPESRLVAAERGVFGIRRNIILITNCKEIGEEVKQARCFFGEDENRKKDSANHAVSMEVHNSSIHSMKLCAAIRKGMRRRVKKDEILMQFGE